MPSMHMATDWGMNDVCCLMAVGGNRLSGDCGWVSVAGQGSAAAVGMSRRS